LNPRVSVIIPTYNQVSFIRDTIDSVLSQDYLNIEIIVTDDGSTDGTLMIIQEYACRCEGKIKFISSEKNTGIASNMNRGLKIATGEFIAWLGGDDLMCPDKIGKQVECLLRNQDAVGCCHDAYVFESDTGKILGLFTEVYNGKAGLREGGIELWFDAKYFMLPSATMIRSSACPCHGFDPRLKFANDWLFDIEVFRNGKCVVINEPLVRYRRHNSNVTNVSQSDFSYFEELSIVLGIIDVRYPELHKMVAGRRSVLHLDLAVKAYFNDDDFGFKNYLKLLIGDGKVIRAITVYVSLRCGGRYLYNYASQKIFYRPRWLMKMFNLLRS
jgi:glycosyltransferase involved in cell wall biosynthesis